LLLVRLHDQALLIRLGSPPAPEPLPDKAMLTAGQHTCLDLAIEA
jgi:hypothetical protein